MKDGSLTAAEVAAGLARLKAAPFMVRNVEYQDDPGSFRIADAATDFIFEAAPGFSETFTAEHGIPADQEEDSIIRDLAYALALSRLTPEELFRLGTSEEALRLFTERGDWQAVARLAS